MDVLTQPEVDVSLDLPDPVLRDTEPVAHIVRQDLVAHSLTTGDKIEALCGRWFTVRMFNPSLPVCEPCKVALANGAARVSPTPPQ